MEKIIIITITILITINSLSQSTLQSSAYPGLQITNDDSQIWLYGDGQKKWSLGSTGASGSDFIIYDNNLATLGVKFSIDELTGNIGIGTVNALEKIHISNGKLLFKSGQNTNNSAHQTGLKFTTDNNNAFSEILVRRGGASTQIGLQFNTYYGEVQETMTLMNNKVGIGTLNPDAKLHIYGTNAGSGNVLASLMIGKNNGAEIQAIQESNDDDVQSLAFRVKSSGLNADDSFEAMRIYKNGNVGIGTTSPQYKLAVKGTIGTGEVIVEDVSSWPDFVFQPTYTLKSLEEVEQFILTNKHLPDVLSEKEVKENGLSLGQSDAVLLQKIEELTLYLIEQNKEVKSEKLKVESLEKEVEKLQAKVEKLEKLNKKLIEIEKQIKELKSNN
jgi:hypothetical protein